MNVINDTIEVCEQRAAEIIAKKLNEIATSKGHVVFGIPGERSVEGVFKNLLEKEIDWQKVHIFMVDEKCVSLNSLESNYRLAYNSFIKQLIESRKMPGENACPFIYEEGNAYKSLRSYDNALAKFGRRFDLVLLSSGEDGHIAALYPNHRSVTNEANAFFLMNDSPKPPKNRITASTDINTIATYSASIKNEKRIELYST